MDPPPAPPPSVCVVSTNPKSSTILTPASSACGLQLLQRHSTCQQSACTLAPLHHGAPSSPASPSPNQPPAEACATLVLKSGTGWPEAWRNRPGRCQKRRWSCHLQKMINPASGAKPAGVNNDCHDHVRAREHLRTRTHGINHTFEALKAAGYLRKPCVHIGPWP